MGDLSNQSDYHKWCRETLAIPLGRAGSAQEYAQVIFSIITVSSARLLLAFQSGNFHSPIPGSGRRSWQNGYMTGSNILIDGGWMRDEGELAPMSRC